MVILSSTVKCLLCQASLNLSSGHLDKIKNHLETAHDVIYDHDLIISLGFLEAEERKKIVETVFPRIKKFFSDVKDRSSQPSPRLGIEKRLLEDEEINSLSSLYRDSKRRKLDHSKFESLNETHSSITAPKPLENFNSSGSSVTSEQMTQCSICQQSMSTSQYIEHIQIVHGTENETGTSDVGDAEESSKSPEKFLNPNESQCDICEKPMLKKSIRKHKQRVHQLYENLKSMGLGDTSSNFDPDVSIDSSVLEPRVDIEEPPVEKEENSSLLTAPCSFCQKPITKKNMKRHIDSVHMKTEPSNETLPMDTDDEGPSDNFILNSQETEHKCKICYARFEELDDLKEHFKDVHDIEYDAVENNEEEERQESKQEKQDDFPYPCDQCDAKYTIKDSLRRHKRNKH